MQTATVHQVPLAYEITGAGEPVVFLHCSFVANAFAQLVREPSLNDHKLITYHRRGYGASAPVQPPFSIEQQAADCVGLMKQLDIPQAHLVGHSFGANVALEVARSAPERVQSLALLEPPLPWAMQPRSLAAMLQVIDAAMHMFASGDSAGATEQWLDGAFGAGWQAVIEQNIPGGVAQVMADGSTALGVEAASLQTWAFGPDDLRAIEQPTLAAYHVETRFRMFDDVQQTLLSHLSQAESLVVPNTTHLLQIQNPRSVAEALGSFFARHPIGEAALAR